MAEKGIFPFKNDFTNNMHILFFVPVKLMCQFLFHSCTACLNNKVTDNRCCSDESGNKDRRFTFVLLFLFDLFSHAKYFLRETN